MRHPVNQGIVHSLNTGLALVGEQFDCDFIARLDCSDICRKDRFDKQLAMLQSNPDVMLVGSWCIFFDQHTGRSFIFKTPTRHHDIIAALNFRNVFVHPSVVWRRTDAEHFYSYAYPHAEDNAFF